MKKPKKSSAGKKRYQKNNRENGQARLRTEQNIRKENSDRLSRVHEAKPREPASPHSPAGRKPQRGEDERKRKLWERKQAELQARWLTAQSLQADQDTARKRKMRIVHSILGTGMAVLLCALAWYVARGSIHINTPA